MYDWSTSTCSMKWTIIFYSLDLHSCALINGIIQLLPAVYSSGPFIMKPLKVRALRIWVTRISSKSLFPCCLRLRMLYLAFIMQMLQKIRHIAFLFRLSSLYIIASFLIISLAFVYFIIFKQSSCLALTFVYLRIYIYLDVLKRPHLPISCRIPLRVLSSNSSFLTFAF